MSPRTTLPNVIVIGAPKCGTTSLHRYLGEHPEIFMSKEKELSFFVEEFNWSKGIDWYKAHFDSRYSVNGESTTLYSHYPKFKGIPARMSQWIPDAKLIYILRDPIQRMISHYMQIFKGDIENRSFVDTMTGPDRNQDILDTSKYFMQLEQYFPFYIKSRILIITLEELIAHKIDTLKKVFRFLNVDDTFTSPKFSSIHNSSSKLRKKTRVGRKLSQTSLMKKIHALPVHRRWYLEHLLYYLFSGRIRRPQLTDGLRHELTNMLRDDINTLREFTGRDFNTWNL